MKKLLLAFVATLLFAATAAAQPPPPCGGNNVCVGPASFGSLFLITDGQKRVEITPAGAWISNINVSFDDVTAGDITADAVTATTVTATTLTPTTISPGVIGMCQPLTSSTTIAGTPASTDQTDLWTYSMPAGTLGRNNDYLKITAVVTYAANGNTKTVNIWFGTANIGGRGPAADNGSAVLIEAGVWRIGSTSQRTFAATNLSTTASRLLTSATPSQNLANAVVLKITGTNGSAAENDIVFRAVSVEICRVPS